MEKSAEAIVVAARWRRAESAVRSRTWIAQTTGKKSKAGDRGNLATKGGEVECRDMGARCQSGCDEKRTREHAERTVLNCGNREVPATGTLRGVGGEAFLPYPICWGARGEGGVRRETRDARRPSPVSRLLVSRLSSRLTSHDLPSRPPGPLQSRVDRSRRESAGVEFLGAAPGDCVTQ